MPPMPRIEPPPKRPDLDRLLDAVRDHKMTQAEREAQRASWVRGELAIGNDRDEGAYRAKMRAEKEDG